MSRRRAPGDDLNPYMALTDTTLNVILVMVFFVATLTAVGRVSWDDVRYKDAQKAFQAAVRTLIVAPRRPVVNVTKNDPPGTQRWSFKSSTLFLPGRAELSAEGQATLAQFGRALQQNRNTWRRIRVEGHTLPTTRRNNDRWEEATNRAAAVARYLVTKGGIEPYFLATAGRGGQDPLPGLPVTAAEHARIEIVLEYAAQAADGGKGK